jgi:hypothetical protein
MGWKDYLAKKSRVYTFEDFGCPDFWVKMRGLESFTHGESLQMMKEMENLSDEESVEASHNLFKKLVIDWNLTDPETDEPLPLPKVDTESLLRLPNEFIVQMNKWAAEGLNVDAAVPPQSGS